jgi:hypothetical protein
MAIPHQARHRSRAVLFALLFGISFGSSGPVASSFAADPATTEIQILRREVESLRLRDEENRARMTEMERMLRQLLESQQFAPGRAGPAPAASGEAAPAPDEALDAAVAESEKPVAGSPQDALDRALAPDVASSPTTVATAGAGRGDLWSARLGGAAQARLIDISLITLVAAGGSSVGDDELSLLELGAHDPNQNGFTLQQAELSLSGAVDPYFTGEAHIVATPGGVELEEAFFTTTALPFGLQVEAGYSLTEFGLINPAHAHAWDWMDQPVVIGRMFGGEGMRSPGARVSWLMPTPFYSQLHIGVQNADEGDLTPSFMGGEGIGGRPNVDRNVDSFGEMVWLGRWDGAFDLSDEAALLVGGSVLYGPNSTGADGDTWIYGGDVKLRWRPSSNFRGWPFVLWQSEVIARDYGADRFLAGTGSGGDGGGGHDHGGGDEEEEPAFPNDLPADTLHDVGFYTQLVYGFRYGWAAGLRAEYATGSGASIEEGVLAPRSDDPLRGDRLRIAPLVVWHPTEFSRFRLQYNYDDADFLSGGDAHTIWIGGEVMYGKHAAHKY